jgi:hypothetical protein
MFRIKLPKVGVPKLPIIKAKKLPSLPKIARPVLLKKRPTRIALPKFKTF